METNLAGARQIRPSLFFFALGTRASNAQAIGLLVATAFAWLIRLLFAGSCLLYPLLPEIADAQLARKSLAQEERADTPLRKEAERHETAVTNLHKREATRRAGGSQWRERGSQQFLPNSHDPTSRIGRT